MVGDISWCAESEPLESVYDNFIERFRKMGEVAVAGDPLMSGTTKGPLISATQLSRIHNYVDKGQKEGATLLFGGNVIDKKGGHYFEDTAFADVTEEMTIMREEIFGPVAVALDHSLLFVLLTVKGIVKFKTEQEVINRANSSDYGLGAAIFTTSVDRAMRVSKKIEAGTVCINSWGLVNAETPFGGVKSSGRSWNIVRIQLMYRLRS